jgi:nitric oxide reductase NorD protein
MSSTIETANETTMETACEPLAQWLRLLWDTGPVLHLDSDAPFISQAGIHLPARPLWQQHCAAAAHAAAHLVYSKTHFDVEGLVPTARALMALLEDARVEALAMRELPGLARLWQPLHVATPDDGHGCELLMARLARALVDRGYVDPHPWVAKGRRLFFLDEGLCQLALRTPDELRTAACRLGHDIGQMRLPFNASGYRPQPAYRDDHRWMWAADRLETVQPVPMKRAEDVASSLAEPAPAPATPEPEPAPPLSLSTAPESTAPESAGPLHAPENDERYAEATVTHHPEWDRLIHRLRPRWCRVIERANAAPPLPVVASPANVRGAVDVAPARHGDPRPAGQGLLAPLRGLAKPSTRCGRSADGEAFHLDALLDWAIDRRARHTPDARVYRARRPHTGRAGIWLLIDSSASTGALQGHGAAPMVSVPTAPGAADPLNAPNAPNAPITNISPSAPLSSSVPSVPSVPSAPSAPSTRSARPAFTVLQSAARAAAAIAAALQTLGWPCAVIAFRSHGRGAVRLDTLQAFGRQDARLAGRLQRLRPGGSTRLGAALRHATARLASHGAGLRGGAARWVLLLSDGQPRDVDVHDPRYLVEDARHAVREAGQRGVRVACLALGERPEADTDAVRIFGRAGVQPLRNLDTLPRALRRFIG